MGLRRLVQFGGFSMVLMCLGVTGILLGISRGDCKIQSVGDGNGKVTTQIQHWVDSDQCKSVTGGLWVSYVELSSNVAVHNQHVCVHVAVIYGVPWHQRAKNEQCGSR